MIKPFKFLKGQSTSPFDVYAERVINESRYGAFRIGQDEPPFGISRRHWNILPQDLRGATYQEMTCYIQGWEHARIGMYENPFHDSVRSILWNRGFTAYQSRVDNPPLRYRNVNPDPPIDETYPEFYNTDELIFFDVTEVMYDPVWSEPYRYMCFRHIEEGNTIRGSRITPEHPMWNFPDII